MNGSLLLLPTELGESDLVCHFEFSQILVEQLCDIFLAKIFCLLYLMLFQFLSEQVKLCAQLIFCSIFTANRLHTFGCAPLDFPIFIHAKDFAGVQRSMDKWESHTHPINHIFTCVGLILRLKSGITRLPDLAVVFSISIPVNIPIREI